MNTSVLVLALCWIFWCILHSLLLSESVKHFLEHHFSGGGYYHRLAYNIIALLTLLPVMAVTYTYATEVLFSWQGWLQLPRLLLLALSVFLFIGGARQYDLSYFLGVWQIRNRRQHLLLSAQGGFGRDGMLNVVRHPWYTGSLLFLWTVLPSYTLGSVVAATILTIYLFIGAHLEERRIIKEFGEGYIDYQRQVSMFFPWKWLKKRCFGEGNGSI